MTKRQQASQYSPGASFLERWLADYFTRRRRGNGDPAAIRIERLRAITRRCVAIAALAGVVSGALVGGGEMYIRETILGDEEVPLHLSWRVWAGFYAFVGVLSALEIAFLHTLAISGVRSIVDSAGAPLAPHGHSLMLAHGIARGALESPNPRDPVFGIDPYALVPKWRLLLLNLAYKLKVSASGVFLRMFMRRLTARLAIRSFVPLLAGPLYAGWNAFILWRIMRETRIRALGPGAIDSILDAMPATRLGTDAAAIALDGVAEMLVCAMDAHPNHVHLLHRLRETTGYEDPLDPDWSARLSCLARLDADARKHTLNLLTLAGIVGSRLTSRQETLLGEAFGACGLKLDRKALRRLRARFIAGHAPDPDALEGVAIASSPIAT